MQRRHFLQSLAHIIAAGGLCHIPAFASAVSWKASFGRAVQKHPWLLGYESVQKPEYTRRPLHVTGRIPEDLQGVLYRNGPARHEVGDTRYHHWFDGDGMVHGFHIEGQKVWHQGRFVATAKYLSEQDGVMRERTFGTALPSMQNTRSADSLNVANINIIEHNGELLALWEGGSAYRLDLETLETLGIKHWNKPTQGAPFSAHPKKDSDGSLWNFGYAPYFNALIIYHISQTGALNKHKVIPMKNTPMVHDFAITENYLVFVLPPFRHQAPSQQSFLEQFAWQPERGGELLIIAKETLQPIAQFPIPAFWMFHFAFAYESGQHEIHLQAPIYSDPSIMTDALRNVMRGQITAFSKARLVDIRLNWKHEEVKITPHLDIHNVEFPTIDTRKQGLFVHNSYMLHGKRNQDKPVFDAVLHIHEQGVQTYDYPPNILAEEHVFVPNPNHALANHALEGQGWLLGTTLDYIERQTTLNIFDAQHIDDGPLAQAKLDIPLPLGLHGSFSQR